jgi:putative transposase
VTKLKRLARFAHWKQLDAQAIQHIVWRIDQGYQKFFRKENKRPPTFRKRSKYHSITLVERFVNSYEVLVADVSLAF